MKDIAVLIMLLLWSGNGWSIDYYVRPHVTDGDCSYSAAGGCNGLTYATAWEGFTGGDGTVVTEVYPEDWTRTVDTSIARRPVNDASPNPISGQPNPTDFQAAALRGASSHGMACNNNAQCLAVWEKEYCNTIQLDSIRVADEGSENGIEPLVYFIADRNDTNPTKGGYELIWHPKDNGGSDMKVSQTPRTTGFPKSLASRQSCLDLFGHLQPGERSSDTNHSGRCCSD